jgi:hypothetical protein
MTKSVKILLIVNILMYFFSIDLYYPSNVENSGWQYLKVDLTSNTTWDSVSQIRYFRIFPNPDNFDKNGTIEYRYIGYLKNVNSLDTTILKTAYWNGNFNAKKSGIHTFTIVSNDCCDLFINGTQIISNTTITDTSSTITSTGTYNMVANQTYTIQMYYGHLAGNPSFSFTYTEPYFDADVFNIKFISPSGKEVMVRS